MLIFYILTNVIEKHVTDTNRPMLLNNWFYSHKTTNVIE